MSPEAVQPTFRRFLRCPVCVGIMDPVTDFGPGQDGLFYDCPRCSIRVKVWEYHRGMK